MILPRSRRRRVGPRSLQTREHTQGGCRHRAVQGEQQPRGPQRVPAEQREEPRRTGGEELVAGVIGQGEPQGRQVVERAAEPALQARVGARGGCRRRPRRGRRGRTDHEPGVGQARGPFRRRGPVRRDLEVPCQRRLGGRDADVGSRGGDGQVCAAAVHDEAGCRGLGIRCRGAGRPGLHLLQRREIPADPRAQPQAHRLGQVGVHGERLRRDAVGDPSLAHEPHLRVGERVVDAAQQRVEAHRARVDDRRRDVLGRREGARGAGVVHPQGPDEPGVAVVDAVDRRRAHVAVVGRPGLSRGRQRHDAIGQERLQSRRHPFTAPSLVFMIRRWKMKNSTATGIVMIAAAASFSGYWVP